MLYRHFVWYTCAPYNFSALYMCNSNSIRYRHVSCNQRYYTHVSNECGRGLCGVLCFLLSELSPLRFWALTSVSYGLALVRVQVWVTQWLWSLGGLLTSACFAQNLCDSAGLFGGKIPEQDLLERVHTYLIAFVLLRQKKFLVDLRCDTRMSTQPRRVGSEEWRQVELC